MNIMDEKSGQSILPVLWDDNYFSLLPGETKKIKVSILNKYLKDKEPVLEIAGWNINKKRIKLV
jgi:exo-1,4-beta-D-glucosaminidase